MDNPRAFLLSDSGETGLAANPVGGVALSPALQAWYMVFSLTLIYCVSFLDRNILSLLAVPIAGALGISKTQLGLLYGLGFGVLYALVGLPLAHWIDRGQRVWIVVIGVTLWSLCTFASAFATSFGQLAILRSGVAIGEAVLSPAAVSLIADLFDRERRTLPTSIYSAVGTVMGYGSYFFAGGALDLATHLSTQMAMAPWRLTLIIVGLPGLLLAPLLRLTVREPERKPEAFETRNYAGVGQAVAYVVANFRLYGFMLFGMAGITALIYGFVTWVPTLLIQGFGVAAAQAGYIVGSVATVGGVCGAVFWPTATRFWMRRGRADAVIILLTVGCSLLSLSILLGGLARREVWLILSCGLTPFAGSCLSLLAPLVVQFVAPSQLRGRLIALYLLPTSLIGMVMGPLLIALMSESVFFGPFALGSAMATLAITVAPLSLWSIFTARHGFLSAYHGKK